MEMRNMSTAKARSIRKLLMHKQNFVSFLS